MRTYILIPGAGGTATWYWHRVAPLLEAAGHTAVPVELPGADPAKGLREYTDLVVEAARGRPGVVLVAQSMGAFTALPACARLPVEHLVLLNAMVPAPHERANDWGEHTGSEAARTAAARANGYPEEFDVDTYFLHDLSRDVLAGGEGHDEAELAFEQPCPFDRWPPVATTVLAGRDDRLFPLEFQRRVARERIGTEVQPLPGGHLNALSEPEAVAGALLAPVQRRVRSPSSRAGATLFTMEQGRLP